MIRILLFVMVLCTTISCKKYKSLKESSDVQGIAYLRGRLFLIDTFTQKDLSLPLANKKVLLSYSDATDTVNYLFSKNNN